jgi:signal transduction histidine kinase
MLMSRANRATGPPALLRWLALLVSLLAVLAATVIGMGIDLVPALGIGLGSAGLMNLPSWMSDVALESPPMRRVLTRTAAMRAQYQRSLGVLLRQAKHLDDVDLDRQEDSLPDGLAAEVSEEMSLSAERMRAQLEQEKAFSGQAAHQLRTPLTALGLQIEELTMNPETPRQVRAELHRARNEVDRLADVITDLLALARRGVLPARGNHSDPVAVAVDATRRWASSAQAVGRDLRLAGTLPDCRVRAPAGPASQVLDVLIDNALKHGTGDIEVSVEVVGDDVRMRVADQGTSTGQAGGEESSSSGGEGMGLLLAEQLAAACGGQMVRADQPTTAFELVLPRQSAGRR